MPAARSVVSNAAFSLMTMMTTAGLTAVLTLVLVRVLDPSGYGLFALAISIGGLVFLPADFGIVNATNRLIAERREDPEAVRALVVDAIRLKLVVGGLVCGALAATAAPIAHAFDAPDLTWPLRLVALAVFGQTMLALLGSVVTTLGRSDFNLRIVATESTLEFVASIAFVAAGTGVVGASAGRAVGYVGGFALAAVLVLHVLAWPSLRRPAGATRAYARRIAGYAGALFVIDGVLTMFSQVDVLLVGAFLDTVAVATFQAPTRLLSFLHYPGYAIAAAVAPRYARRDGEPFDPTLIARGVRLIVLFQPAVMVPTVVWARPIADLVLGDGYADSADVLVALAPFTFLVALGPIVSMTVNYAGAARRRVPIAIAALVVDAVIGVVLIPTIGVVGGAISTDTGYALYVGAHLWICREVLGLPLRPLAGVFGRAALAAAAMAGVLLAFGTDHLSVLDWIAGAVLGAAAYAAVLLVTRAVTRDELRDWLALIRRRSPR